MYEDDNIISGSDSNGIKEAKERMIELSRILERSNIQIYIDSYY